MIILAIETSCDDTGISILKAPKNKKGCFEVLSNIVSSQIEIHKKYGGVYPAMAKREHQRNLTRVLENALKQAGMLNKKTKGKEEISQLKIKELKKILSREPELFKKLIIFLKKYEKPNIKNSDNGKIDLIAITNGPGLEPCLWAGINFAKALSYFWDIPIVPVNHIESHILVNLLNLNKTTDNSVVLKFPAICLVVSGGHTQIILMKKNNDYKILGETRDDAAGECFDKAAKILGLGYPGGPIISRLATENSSPQNTNSIKLPRPMIGTKDYDFSFSGLKTAILYHHKKQSIKTQKSKKYIIKMCAEIQQAIIDVLIKKTINAAKNYKAKTIILGGGVSANEELRKQFQKNLKKGNYGFLSRDKKPYQINLLFPPINPINLSTDNGLMTAVAGYFHCNKKICRKKIQADANQQIN